MVQVTLSWAFCEGPEPDDRSAVGSIFSLFHSFFSLCYGLPYGPKPRVRMIVLRVFLLVLLEAFVLYQYLLSLFIVRAVRLRNKDIRYLKIKNTAFYLPFDMQVVSRIVLHVMSYFPPLAFVIISFNDTIRFTDTTHEAYLALHADHND